jgi:hypothetical protein
VSTPTRLAIAAGLLLACLAGPLACEPGYGNQEPSWEPPTASEKRVERIREEANAEPGDEKPGAG